MFYVILISGVLAGSGSIEGAVRDEQSKEPISTATVSIPELGRTVVTNSRGTFVLRGVPAGRWRIEARALGYQPHSLTISSPASGVVRLDFELSPQPIELRPLTVRTQRAHAWGKGGPDVERALFDREVMPGAVGVSQEEIRSIPAFVEPDVLRSLQALPGVVRRNDLSAQLHVYGGGPDQNLFLLDGARVIAPYHMFGMFGGFNPDAVSRVEFFRGALPARHGGALSSVIEVEQREGDGSPRFDAGIGLLAARLTAAGSLPRIRGGWLISGRRTHLDAVAELTGNDFPYAFHDLQGGVNLSPGGGHDFRASFFTSADRFRMFFGGGGDDLHARWSNNVASLRWSWTRGGRWSAGATIWGSGYVGHLVAGDSATADVVTSRVGLGGLRLEAARQGEDTGFRFGLDAELGRVTLLGGTEPGSYVVGTTRNGYFLPAAYAEAERWLGPVRLMVGLRGMHRSGAGQVLLEPRAAARLHFTDDIVFTIGAGRTHQILSSIQDDRHVLPGTSLWTVRPDPAPVSRSDGVTAGLEAWLGREWSISAASYARSFNDVPRWRPIGSREISELAYDDGSAIGVELSARRHAGRITGWLGYGFARVQHEEEGSGRNYEPPWDRRHSLESTVFIRLWEHLSLSNQLVYGSGLPFWPFQGYVSTPRFTPLVPSRQTPPLEQAPLWGDEQMRYPDYFRVDLGIRSSFRIRGVEVEPFASVLNVTGRPNVLYYELRGTEGGQTTGGGAVLEPVNPFPLTRIPSLGVDVHF